MSTLHPFESPEQSPTVEEEKRRQTLLNEGLELLRCFQAIEDPKLRASVLDVVKTLTAPAAESPSASPTPLDFPRR